MLQIRMGCLYALYIIYSDKLLYSLAIMYVNCRIAFPPPLPPLPKRMSIFVAYLLEHFSCSLLFWLRLLIDCLMIIGRA